MPVFNDCRTGEKMVSVGVNIEIWPDLENLGIWEFIGLILQRIC